MTIELSPQQQEAYGLIEGFMDSPRGKCHYTGGYAGTGKTTVLKELRANLSPYQKSRIPVMAPTGKAADVLRKKGVTETETIHSVIYAPQSTVAGRLRELREMLEQQKYADAKEKLAIEKEIGELVKRDPSFSMRDLTDKYDFFMVDEFSMVGRNMFEDISSFGVPIIAFGDPGQLPPVKDGRLPFSPHFVMDEIHRQAKDNPIIQMAHMARTGKFIKVGDYGQGCMKIDKDENYKSEMLLEYDQIICYTNECRRRVNKRVRQLLGHTTKFPKKGEKVVCRKNNHALKIWNGAIYTTVDDSMMLHSQPYIRILGDGNEPIECRVYPIQFEEYVRKVQKHEHWSYEEQDGYENFDYGYCITGHLSQGSEWDSVLVIDETDIMRNEDEARQWLYTAITRAAKRVTIMRR